MSFVRMLCDLRGAMDGLRLKLLNLPEVLIFDFILNAIFWLRYCFGTVCGLLRQLSAVFYEWSGHMRRLRCYSAFMV